VSSMRSDWLKEALEVPQKAKADADSTHSIYGKCWMEHTFSPWSRKFLPRSNTCVRAYPFLG
jgi:hypothetical protein